jgi:hypothetical protein
MFLETLSLYHISFSPIIWKMHLEKSLQKYNVKETSCYPPIWLFLKNINFIFHPDNAGFNKCYPSQINRLEVLCFKITPFGG